MSTIMQKDVLIEITAETIAAIWRITELEALQNNSDFNRMIEIREFLYASSPENIEYQETLAGITAPSAKANAILTACPARKS